MDEEELPLLNSEAEPSFVSGAIGDLVADGDADDDPSCFAKLTRYLMDTMHGLSPLHEEISPDEEFERACSEQIKVLDQWKFSEDPDKAIWRYVFHIPQSPEEASTMQAQAFAILESTPDCLHQAGPLGALPVHLCYVLGTEFHLSLGRKMLRLDKRLRKGPEGTAWARKHPEKLILRYYDDAVKETDVFHGENLLHIAIVSKNLLLAEELVREDPRLLVGRVSGSFFAPGRPTYYGSTPLQFAACNDNVEMFELLLKYAPAHARYHNIDPRGVPGVDHPLCSVGSDSRAVVQQIGLLDEKDVWGNNILHALAYQSSDADDDNRSTLVSMFDYVIMTESRLRGQVYTETSLVHKHSLESSLNDSAEGPGMIPFVLAADLGRKNLFLHMLRRGAVTNWSYGPLVCRSYPLDGLDEPPDCHPDSPCALDCIVNQGHLNFFEVLTIEKIVHKKWKAYASSIFIIRLWLCLVYAFFIILVAITENMLDPDTRPRLSPTRLNVAYHVNLVSKVMIGIGALLQFLKEARQLKDDGVVSYVSDTGAAFMENFCNWCYFISLGTSIVMDSWAMDRGIAHMFMAVTVLSFCSYFFFFLLGFRLTGPYVVMIGRMIKSDLARFAFAFVVIVLGFATSFHLLFKASRVSDYVLTVRDVFLMAVGQLDQNQFFVNVHCPWLCTILMICYVMCITVLLLNLLIATMAQTYADLLPSAQLVWLLERARITQSICSEFSPTMRGSYTVMQSAPPNEALPSDVDLNRWMMRRYLLQLESIHDDVSQLCKDDVQALFRTGVSDEEMLRSMQMQPDASTAAVVEEGLQRERVHQPASQNLTGSSEFGSGDFSSSRIYVPRSPRPSDPQGSGFRPS